MTDREAAERLIKLSFELAMVAAESMHMQSTEHIAAWVRNQLTANGIGLTVPMGMSWGEYKPQ